MNEVKQVITIMIRAKSAESGPPLGTVLGNIGVNAIKFAKEFNDFTENLPNCLKVKVKIIIYKNNNFTFIIKLPTIGHMLSLFKKDEYYYSSTGQLMYSAYLDFLDILKIAVLKFPGFPLEKALLIVLGTVQNMNLKIKIINLI
jgi:ribosomal protein L11